MTVTGDVPNQPVTTDPQVPLANLTAICHRVDSLSRHLSLSVNARTIIPQDEMDAISSELISTIHQVIINGASLLASQCQTLPNQPISTRSVNPDPHPEPTTHDDDPEDGDFEIVEIDAVELLAEHIHICDICGKGFKRDANLRMHMRAHGDQYKTSQALAKPDMNPLIYLESTNTRRSTRFSCPYRGCNRNQHSPNFKPLKSVICVKNHFKRSHCPKMYSCTTCNKKSFSVVADLRNHLRTCGEPKWKCSCGTNFTRKDKLFAHIALFDGHMPLIGKAAAPSASNGVVCDGEVVARSSCGDGLEFDEFVDGFEGNLMDEFFRF